MNVELMVLTMNMEARPTMVEDGDGVAEVMNVVTRRATSPPWRRLQRLAYLFTECCRRAAQELNSGNQGCLWSRVGGGGEDHRVGRRGY